MRSGVFLSYFASDEPPTSLNMRYFNEIVKNVVCILLPSPGRE